MVEGWVVSVEAELPSCISHIVGINLVLHLPSVSIKCEVQEANSFPKFYDLTTFVSCSGESHNAYFLETGKPFVCMVIII